jgi:protein SCO1/2
LLDRQFLAVQREIATDARLRDRLHLVSVTLDPAYDRPPVLREHAARIGAQPAVWSFVTGEREELDRFGSKLGVAVMRDDPAGAAIVHNLRTAVIDPEGRLGTIFTGNEWRAPDLLKELRRAVDLR